MASAILSFLLLFTSSFPKPLGHPTEAKLNKEFEIQVGKSVSIRNEGMKISFSNVAEDSRCPEGVACVWAGNGKVVLKLSKAGKRSATMSLNTGLDPKHDIYRGYDVKLVSLNPYPKKNVGIKKEEYVARLVVSRK
jgi:hypothetical protein